MEDSSESAYSPSIHSADEDYPDMHESFMSTRSCSQMIISSQGSSKDTTEVTRKHRKGSGRMNRRFQLSTVRKPFKPATKNIASSTTFSCTWERYNPFSIR